MKLERAIEILNPEHREHYDDLEEVNEACRMGMEALKAKLAEEDGAATAAQWEKAIYKAAVERFGDKVHILMAVEKMAELTKVLVRYLRFGACPEVLKDIAEKRADVEIILNLLHVIFGDCSNWKHYILAQVEKELAEDGMPAVRYRCACPEYEERPCDNPNEDIECRDCQHGVSENEA